MKLVKLLLIFLILLIQSKLFSQDLGNCKVNNIEFIIGGKSNSQSNSFCINSKENTKNIKEIKNTATRNSMKIVDLKDKNTVTDRVFILQNELKKAINLKNEFLIKQNSGVKFDKQQLKRVEADIRAIKNELSRI